MLQNKRTRFKNRLAMFRRRMFLERKQVANLLGHKTVDQISRYERGLKMPSLATAMKLEAIYSTPIAMMLDGYFQASQKGIHWAGSLAAKKDQDPEIDYCSIEERLKRPKAKPSHLLKAYTHCARLIRRRAELQGDL